MGFLIYMPFFHIISLQKVILEDIHKEEYLVFTTGLIGLTTMIMDLACALYLVFIKHNTRVVWAIFLSVISMVTLMLSISIQSFSVYNFGILLMSFGFSIMVNTVIGFMKAFSIQISKGFGIGIGFSGLFSSLFILIIEYLGLSYKICFIYIVGLQILLYFMV